MREVNPFDGLDLDELFASMNASMESGGSIVDPLTRSEIAPEDLSQKYEDQLRLERINLLDERFSRYRDPKVLTDMDPREAAKQFKQSFAVWQYSVLGNPSSSSEKRVLAETTTLENLAQAASDEYERRLRFRGQQVPNSDEYEVASSDAFRWDIISTIVRGASEIRD